MGLSGIRNLGQRVEMVTHTRIRAHRHKQSDESKSVFGDVTILGEARRRQVGEITFWPMCAQVEWDFLGFESVGPVAAGNAFVVPLDALRSHFFALAAPGNKGGVGGETVYVEFFWVFFCHACVGVNQLRVKQD